VGSREGDAAAEVDRLGEGGAGVAAASQLDKSIASSAEATNPRLIKTITAPARQGSRHPA
jgi:hypothetical protein